MRRWAARAALVLGGVALVLLAALWLALRASLPRLDGTLRTPGHAAPVTIERDARGVTTVRASGRLDLAWGTGFAHAQDRFFQMDLARRLAAGELAEIFGPAALDHDRRARTFRFRALALEAAARAPPQAQALAAAYARGVNAGIGSLGARPWEYLLLRAVPQPWREEDSLLVLYSMWWQLQYSAIERDIVREAVRAAAAALPAPPLGTSHAFDFLYPRGTEWDAPLNVSLAASRDRFAAVPVPVREHWDLGTRAPGRRSDIEVRGGPPLAAGSNNFAIAGALTTSGAALVANDMHLGLELPPVWYRMRLTLEPAHGARRLDLNGVTLAGTPALVAGSNGQVAWSFTNSYGDWVETEPAGCDAPGYARTVEWIAVRGRRERERLIVRDSPRGRIVARAADQCYAVRWTALDPEATSFALMELEDAASLSAALLVAPRAGMPHQNFIAGDAAGRIGWTIAGRIPRRTPPGEEAARSAGTAAPRAAPGGYLSPEEYPEVVDPPHGRLWTANARPIEGEGEIAIGGDEAANGADYELGSRAHQIREALHARPGPFAARDLLAVQLDDRALFLARWRDLLLRLLDEPAVAQHASRRTLRAALGQWDARASADSVAYLLVREFRDRTERETWEMLLEGLGVELDDPRPSMQFEGALWRLVTEQPRHLLAPEHASWREFLLSQADAVLDDMQARCGKIDRCRWGAQRPVRLRHVLSRALPSLLQRITDLPALELPGDRDMPRVQVGAFGASERFAVSPGRESQGYLHIAGGQSGHPLSSFYRAGIREWAEGRPLPFLPGPAQHRLRLLPAAGGKTRGVRRRGREAEDAKNRSPSRPPRWSHL